MGRCPAWAWAWGANVAVRSHAALIDRISVVFVYTDHCPVPPPGEGGQRCLQSDLGLAVGEDFEWNQLTGTWFLAARSRRVLELQADGLMMNFNVDHQQGSVTVTFAWPPPNRSAPLIPHARTHAVTQPSITTGVQ